MPSLVPIGRISADSTDGKRRDSRAALAQCDAFIGADGGALHLAAACGLPMVALFENNPYKVAHWYPWQVSYELLTPASGTIASISVEQVIHAWQHLMAPCPPPH